MLLAAASVSAESRIPIGNAKYDDAAANVFLDDELTFITVTMAPADLQAMLDDPYSDVYRVCTVHIVNSRINETHHDVGIRPRGNTSRAAIKKSWKLKFNEFVPGREFHGVEKLNINGEHNDPSIIRSKLAWDLHRRIGTAAPRANHVHFKINDGALVEGIFICVEQIDDEFVDAWFGNNGGNLYKCVYKNARADLRYIAPGTPETYQNLGGGLTYQEENNEAAPDYTDLAEFIDFINHSDDATFAADLVNRFSVDNFLRCMAVDVAVGNWDNYWYGANNYFLYHNQDTGRFEYLPYDLDNTYGIDFFGIDWALRPYDTWGNGGFGSTGGQLPPLIARVLNVPEYEAQFRRYLRQIVGAEDAPAAPPPVEYNDTVGDVFSGLGPHYDIVSVEVSNDATNLYLKLRVNGPVDVGGDTGNGEYLFLFNTRTGGSTSNPWGRSINATVQHDFFIGSWPDGGGGALFYERQPGYWQQQGSVSIDLTEKTSGIIRYTVALDRLDLAAHSVFTFDAVATGGGTSDPGFDHLSNPNIATPNYSTPSTPGPYLSYTVQPADVPGGGDGPFTLAQVEAKIDAIKTMIAPYAFQGSYSGGNMDWGYDAADFNESYTLPTSYRNWGWGWDWGLKPFINARTNYLLANVPAPPPLPRLFINEVLPSNRSVIADETGAFEDWVEIYNDEEVPVDVGGMYLTDDPARPKKWPIPAGVTVPAKGHLLVWCDEDPGDGPLHASFKLSAEGEGVGLFHRDSGRNVLIDYLSFPQVGVDISYGRHPDGGAALGYMTTVTPAAANAAHNAPPRFEDVTRTPADPAATDTVWIIARVTDDGAVTSVTLTYDAGAGSQNAAMLDDGQHQDGAAGDQVYGASIPARPPGTAVSYYLTATDDCGAVYRDPPTAPVETYGYVVDYVPPPLFINEYMADNDGVIQDPDEPGEYPDWLEIYNAGDEPIDLEGMFLTDNQANPGKYRIPASVVVPARGFVLFWADEDSSQGPRHTNFKLSASGESIGLYDTTAMGQRPIDMVTFGPQSTDVSEGRFGDGGPCIRVQSQPTPGGTNLPRYGDQNDDGAVDGLDIRVFVQTLLSPAPAPPAVERGDLNCDGVVNLDDAPLLVGVLLD